MHKLNETHDPGLTSWVNSANTPDTDFPIQNLPFGAFRRSGSTGPHRCGVAIGSQILDLRELSDRRLVKGSAADALEACTDANLNRFMGLGRAACSALRAALSQLLRADSADAAQLKEILVPQADVEYGVPADVRGYTHFYASIHHALTLGSFLRPGNPLLPNYRWVPIAHHGRASSIGVSKQRFARPVGQVLPHGASRPELLPTRLLDFQLEIGMFIGAGNPKGSRIAIDDAETHIFGLCLLNGWAARDLQAWEHQPLGPFLARNFAATVSPWIVTLEALAPFRVPWFRPNDDPQPLDYLSSSALRQTGSVDIQLEAYVVSERMRDRNMAPQRLCRTNFRHSYWSLAQMVAHHTVNGCHLRTGDLLASGTQSGPFPEEAGSMLELTDRGLKPIGLPSGESRTFLEDGDEVILRGWCEANGHRRIGLGEATGSVLTPGAVP